MFFFLSIQYIGVETFCNRNKIKKLDLFSIVKNDFALTKYFRSYMKILQTKSEDSIRSILPQSEIEDLLIITNNNFDEEIFNSNLFIESDDIKMDNLLKTNNYDYNDDKCNESFTNTKAYKLNWNASTDCGDIKNKLKFVLQNTSIFHEFLHQLLDIMEFKDDENKW